MIKDLILFGKVLYEQGLNHSHSGNISVRNGNNILIKKHGAFAIGENLSQASLYVSVAETASKIIYLNKLYNK